MKFVGKIVGFAIGFATLTFLISPGPGQLMGDSGSWEWRNQIISLTGLIALSLMTVAVMLALRLSWLDRRIGLDRVYRLHKWVGIMAAVFALLHWLIRQVPRWLVELGIVADPGDRSSEGYSQMEIFFYSTGQTVGEYAFYAIAVLVVIALLQRVPYRIFKKTHRFVPAMYILLAYHGATAQLRERWLATPAGYVVIALAVVGIAAASIALSRRIGVSRRSKAVVTAVATAGRVTTVALAVRDGVLAHTPGQFAFVRFAHDKEPHPFTITTASSDGKTLGFAIKSLGDYTNALAGQVNEGQVAEIEGPYGRFTFEAPEKRQAWVAAGIGITPFMSRLEHLAQLAQLAQLANRPTSQPIDFWYCTTTVADGAFPADLESLCTRSGVRLHRVVTGSTKRLTAEDLQKALGNFEDVSLWFCGPAAFGRALQTGTCGAGLPESAFHQEDFEMR
jgi:predicted ferric reductase